LSDYIKDVGAPLFLSSDNAKEENLGEWISICRTFGIQKRSSEPYYQHQNKIEQRIQDIKRCTSLIMKDYNAPEKFWDYACEYITELINHTATRRLDWRTPSESLHGETPDISVFRYFFYEPIYYMDPSVKFPQHNMLPRRFLGIAPTTGDSLSLLLSKKII
jgi:hypothetical protein